jgi:FKBP-type peptidyl-prolyl cis-trans isomerase SlyD
MIVSKNMVVTIDYTVTDTEGEELDTSKGSGPFSYIQGTGSVVPGLEAALEGRSPEERVKVTVSPKDGYGERDEALIFSVPKERLGEIEDLEIGSHFHVRKDSGEVIMLTVTGIKGDTVTVDGNHPLAGSTLNFDVTVKDVRAATEEELAHGHSHCGEECGGECGHGECGDGECGDDCGCGCGCNEEEE